VIDTNCNNYSTTATHCFTPTIFGWNNYSVLIETRNKEDPKVRKEESEMLWEK